MKWLYDLTLRLGQACLPLLRAVVANGKLRRFVDGQLSVWDELERGMAEVGGHVVWVHAASLGEFGVARPIISALKRRPETKVVVTFFSPSGYEVVSRRDHGVDGVYYLPLDTPRNARRFLDIVRPDKAVFMISEYWLNYLDELRRRGIPVYAVSSVIRRDSVFFKWYGGLYRRALRAFTRFMVLDAASVDNLAALGYDNAVLTGDPLFDNAAAVAAAPWSDEVVERFTAGRQVFFAGSVSDAKDAGLVAAVANANRDIRFVIVPHDIEEGIIAEIRSRLDGGVMLRSQCVGAEIPDDVQSLIVDYVGGLAYMYRYGRWAYVGGGFTPYLHSLIEAVVYGLPVAFGPETERKVMAEQLMRLGIGRRVSTPEEIVEWFASLRGDARLDEGIRRAAVDFARRNCGATMEIIELMEENGRSEEKVEI